MTTPAKDHVLDWLRDAHAVEQQAEQMLRAQSGRFEHYPGLKARIDQHIEETVQQQRLVDSCIHRLGGSTSVIKDMAGRITAFGQGLSGMMVSDEVVKGAMSSYVFEQLEIASYTTLRAAAEHCGDTETVRVCDAILPQGSRPWRRGSPSVCPRSPWRSCRVPKRLGSKPSVKATLNKLGEDKRHG